MIACNRERTQEAGFTVVELVVVIVIIGILAAFAAPRFFDDRTFLERGYYEELAAALELRTRLCGDDREGATRIDLYAIHRSHGVARGEAPS